MICHNFFPDLYLEGFMQDFLRRGFFKKVIDFTLMSQWLEKVTIFTAETV